MIKVGIVGAGYTAAELIRLLVPHQEVEIAWITWRTGKKGDLISDIYPHLKGILDLEWTEINDFKLPQETDLVFLALPHGLSMDFAPGFLERKVKLIDFSADYRLNNLALYEKWYKEHTSSHLMKEAVYGLPELFKDEIKKARLIANPGCYPTATILALAPLLKEGLVNPLSLIVDAKSGVSGAGRNLNRTTHYGEVNESLKAYKIFSHRHQPEMEEKLSFFDEKVSLSFVPHLIPMTRGILATCYAKLAFSKKGLKNKELGDLYRDFYEDAPFVRIMSDMLPATKYVMGTNYVDILPLFDEKTENLVVVSAIDNLMKGAAGQAVQNMNLIFKLDETEGLDLVPLYP